MAKIGLIDLDGKNFPNIPLMKISAFHKQKGDSVDWVTIGDYDKTYISKIFTFSPEFKSSTDFITLPLSCFVTML